MKVRQKKIFSAVQYRLFHPPSCVIETHEVQGVDGEKPVVRVVNAFLVGHGTRVIDGDWIVGWPDHPRVYSEQEFEELFEVIE